MGSINIPPPKLPTEQLSETIYFKKKKKINSDTIR